MVVPAAFVADASFALPWVFGDEHSPSSDEAWEAMKLGKASVHVPALWLWELTNTLVIGERRGRITLVQTAAFFRIVNQLPIRVAPTAMASLFDEIPRSMRTHALTAYDAAYLELAKRSRLPLATLDRELKEAARRDGVELVGE